VTELAAVFGRERLGGDQRVETEVECLVVVALVVTVESASFGILGELRRARRLFAIYARIIILHEEPHVASERVGLGDIDLED
jgi:hypothetical protein